MSGVTPDGASRGISTSSSQSSKPSKNTTTQLRPPQQKKKKTSTMFETFENFVLVSRFVVQHTRVVQRYPLLRCPHATLHRSKSPSKPNQHNSNLLLTAAVAARWRWRQRGRRHRYVGRSAEVMVSGAETSLFCGVVICGKPKMSSRSVRKRGSTVLQNRVRVKYRRTR